MSRNYKKICNELTEFAKSHDYEKPALLKVEHTAFRPAHKVSRGRNGVSELLELQTRIIEADGVYIHAWERSSLLTVYVSSPVRSQHGFGSERGSFVRVRDAKGKYHSFEAMTAWEESDINVNAMQRALGDYTPADYAPEEFKDFTEGKSTKVLKLVGGEPVDRDLERLKREFAEKFYRDLVKYDLDDGRTERFEKFLTAIGFKLVAYFNFTERFWGVSPDYFEQTRNGFEIGWTTKGTYNSLPQTLKVTKSRGIKTVGLSEIGIEGSGYYSHSDRMQILPEQVKEAKRYAARFRAKQQKITQAVVKQALKAA